MKTRISFAVLVSFLFVFSAAAVAGEKATPQEVYEKLLQASEVLETMGEEGLAAFKDPKGEFAWKDTYVFAINCDTLTVAAHPKKSRIGKDISNNRDKNPDPAKRKNHSVAMCEASKNPQGGWVDYYWTKLGDDTPHRKISFVIRAQNLPYALCAGIYNDAADVNALNAELK